MLVMQDVNFDSLPPNMFAIGMLVVFNKHLLCSLLKKYFEVLQGWLLRPEHWAPKGHPFIPVRKQSRLEIALAPGTRHLHRNRPKLGKDSSSQVSISGPTARHRHNRLMLLWSFSGKK